MRRGSWQLERSNQMDFTYEELAQKELRHYVWHRNQGNLVIIVIDDECFHVRRDYKQLFDPQLAIFSLLRDQILSWSDTRAIGFFQLVKTEPEANKVLEVIHQWLNQIATSGYPSLLPCRCAIRGGSC